VGPSHSLPREPLRGGRLTAPTALRPGQNERRGRVVLSEFFTRLRMRLWLTVRNLLNIHQISHCWPRNCLPGIGRTIASNSELGRQEICVL